MATIIDSLLVVLGLDARGFDAGRKRLSEGQKHTRDDAEKTGKTFDEFGKTAGNAIGKLRNEAIGLFLAFQGASSIQSFIGNMVTGDAATSRLARNLGMSTIALSAYGLAIKNVGGDVDEAKGAFSLLAQAREQLKLTGSTGHDREFMLLGFKKGDLDDPANAMQRLAEAAQKMPRTQFYNLAHQMGLTDGVINLLTLGPVKMRELVKAREADAAASEDQGRQAEALEAKWANLAAIITGYLRPAVYDIVDGALKVIDTFTHVIKVSPGVQVALSMIGGVASAVGDTFKFLGAEVMTVMNFVGDQLAQFEKTYAHFVFATHGIFGARDVYAAMIGAGVKNTDDIDRAIDARRAREAAAGGPAAAAGGASSGDVRGNYDAVIGNGRFGSARVSSMSMGDVYQFGRNVLIPRTKAAGIGRDSRGVVGSSAAGKYQITGETLSKYAPRLFGSNWRNMTFDAAAQEKLAEAIFNDSKGGNLKSVWASLPDARRGAYAGRSWAQVRGLIARSESGGGRGGSRQPANVTIGSISLPGVQNADQFAAQLPGAIRRRGLTTQANRGLD